MSNNEINQNLIEQFVLLVKQIEHDISKDIEPDKNRFRLAHMKKALSVIRKFPNKIKSSEDLKGIAGIGKGILARIDEILKTGKLAEIKIKKKEEKELDYVENLKRVIGIGEKKAIDLIRNYGIHTVDELQDAIDKDKVYVNDKIKLGLKYYGVYERTIPRSEMKLIDKFLRKEIVKVDPLLKGIVCGSYRRKKPTSNDIDFLIIHPSIKTMKQMRETKINYLKMFVDHLHKINFLLDDLTDKNIITKYMGFCRLDSKHAVRRIDIRFVPTNSFYTALLHFTGSGEFNQLMRHRAISLGYKLSEYGLYKIIDKKAKKYEKISVKSEEDIFDKLGMKYVPPDKRSLGK